MDSFRLSNSSEHSEYGSSCVSERSDDILNNISELADQLRLSDLSGDAPYSFNSHSSLDVDNYSYVNIPMPRRVVGQLVENYDYQNNVDSFFCSSRGASGTDSDGLILNNSSSSRPSSRILDLLQVQEDRTSDLSDNSSWLSWARSPSQDMNQLMGSDLGSNIIRPSSTPISSSSLNMGNRNPSFASPNQNFHYSNNNSVFMDNNNTHDPLHSGIFAPSPSQVHYNSINGNGSSNTGNNVNSNHRLSRTRSSNGFHMMNNHGPHQGMYGSNNHHNHAPQHVQHGQYQHNHQQYRSYTPGNMNSNSANVSHSNHSNSINRMRHSASPAVHGGQQGQNNRFPVQPLSERELMHLELLVTKTCREILRDASAHTLKAVELANTLRARVGTEVLAHVREQCGGLLSLLEKYPSLFRVDRIPKNDMVTLISEMDINGGLVGTNSNGHQMGNVNMNLGNGNNLNLGILDSDSNNGSLSYRDMTNQYPLSETNSRLTDVPSNCLRLSNIPIIWDENLISRELSSFADFESVKVVLQRGRRFAFVRFSSIESAKSVKMLLARSVMFRGVMVSFAHAADEGLASTSHNSFENESEAVTSSNVSSLLESSPGDSNLNFFDMPSSTREISTPESLHYADSLSTINTPSSTGSINGNSSNGNHHHLGYYHGNVSNINSSIFASNRLSPGVMDIPRSSASSPRMSDEDLSDYLPTGRSISNDGFLNGSLVAGLGRSLLSGSTNGIAHSSSSNSLNAMLMMNSSNNPSNAMTNAILGGGGNINGNANMNGICPVLQRLCDDTYVPTQAWPVNISQDSFYVQAVILQLQTFGGTTSISKLRGFLRSRVNAPDNIKSVPLKAMLGAYPSLFVLKNNQVGLTPHALSVYANVMSGGNSSNVGIHNNNNNNNNNTASLSLSNIL